MCVWFFNLVGLFVFILAHQNLEQSQKPFLKLFKLTWIQTFWQRMKTGLINAVKKLSLSQQEMAGVDICSQVGTKPLFSISRDSVLPLGLGALCQRMFAHKFDFNHFVAAL